MKWGVRLYDFSTVHPTGQKSKKCPQVDGLPVALSRCHAKIRRAGYRQKTQDALDRYFLAFEEGKLREELCTARIEELSGKLASLEARRADLVGEISGSSPEMPTPGKLARLRQEIQRSLTDGPLPERKAAMQSVVAEIKVRDRGHIKPVFCVPVFRPPYGLVPPAGHVKVLHKLGLRLWVVG
jgi:hypothetical protein